MAAPATSTLTAATTGQAVVDVEIEGCKVDARLHEQGRHSETHGLYTESCNDGLLQRLQVLGSV